MGDVHGPDLLPKDWCARLEQAVTDGRFLEDPAHWRAHVATCSACRKTVEGVFLLRDYVGRARLNENLGDRPPLVGEEVVAEALSRHRAERQRLLMLWGLGASVLLAVGGMVLRGRSGDEPQPAARTHAVEETEPAENDAAVAHALELHHRIAPPGEPPRFDLLAQDEALRNELLRALDHPSSFVRRLALSDLTESGIELEPRRLEQFLLTFDETLDGPVTSASGGGDAARRVWETLAQRRSQTLLSALTGAGTQAARGGAPVRPAVVTPFLVHPEARIRQAALDALAQDASYQPADEVERLFASDPDDAVRADAGLLILKRQGERGASTVVARLRAQPDWKVEEVMAGSLGGFPGGLSLARERTEDPATPMVLALLHARSLARIGERAAALRLLPKAVADGDAGALSFAVVLAQELGADDLREPLQARWRKDSARWRADSSTAAGTLADYLILWDQASGEEPRLQWALEVIRDLSPDLGFHARRALDRLSASPLESARRRAEDLRREFTPKR